MGQVFLVPVGPHGSQVLMVSMVPKVSMRYYGLYVSHGSYGSYAC